MGIVKNVPVEPIRFGESLIWFDIISIYIIKLKKILPKKPFIFIVLLQQGNERGQD